MSLTEESVARLMMANRAMVFGYVRSIVRDGELTEEILQDLSVTALRKRDEIDSAEVFPAWIRKAARFEALAALRKRRRDPTVISADVLDLLDQKWEQGAASLRGEGLTRCIEELTERSRWLLHLKYFQNLSGAEIAETTDRPLNTVYVTLSRIHRQLRECVERFVAREEMPHGG